MRLIKKDFLLSSWYAGVPACERGGGSSSHAPRLKKKVTGLFFNN